MLVALHWCLIFKWYTHPPLQVYDLLNGRKKLNILEDGKKQVCVVGLKVRHAADVSSRYTHNKGVQGSR